MEYDEFQAPFQWIGKIATITIEPVLSHEYLYIVAGSPDFSGTRNITVTVQGSKKTEQIMPGWHAYQFKLADQSQIFDSKLDVAISIDRMLDIKEDPRDLGIMIREIHCLDQLKSDVECHSIAKQRNMDQRINHYSSPQAPGILWLASFPRSGNTWMRFLLSNLLFEPIHESTKISRYIDEVIDPVYDIHDFTDRKITAFGSKPAHIIKTHLPFSMGMPLIKKTIGAILIVRNPLDIAVSLSKFSSGNSDQALDDFLTYGIDPKAYYFFNYINWHAHLFSWIRGTQSQDSMPVYVVKYEDLVSDPFSVCAKFLDWLHLEKTTNHIYQAIERSSIENLRKMEAAEIANETPGIFYTLEYKSRIRDGWRFLADGKCNNYREYLTESQIEKGMATFGSVMKQFNYI